MNISTQMSRNNDPATSHLAAEAMNKSGKKKANYKIIAAFIKKNAGLTAAEIGEKTGLGQHEVSRRLSELDGISVNRCTPRKCSIKGTMMATWA